MAGEGGGPQLLACLTGWLNHQLAHHPSMPAARVAHLLTDLRDGLVLLAVLEVLLPGLQAAREEAVHLRPHRLANLATVLATLQKERVEMEVTAEQVEAGEEEATVAVVWGMVRHWQLELVCLGTGLVPPPGPDTLVLAWARSVPGLAATTDLTTQWTDGSALCRLALHHDVSPAALTAALERPPARRLETVVQTLQTCRLLPPGLLDAADLLEGRLDLRTSLTALLCLFQALRPTITRAMVEEVPVAGDPSLAPPAPHLPPLPTDLPPAGWSAVLEEVVGWLEGAEQHLLALHSLGQRQLETVRQKFYNHEEFMLDLQARQGAVKKVESLQPGTSLAKSDFNSKKKNQL